MTSALRKAADLLNKTTVYVLCNTFGPVAVYDNADLACEMLAQAEESEDQQNNSIEEFVLNEHPDISSLLAS